MKKVLTGIALVLYLVACLAVGAWFAVLFPDPVEAATVEQVFEDGDRSPTLQECETIGDIALKIMALRQVGLPKREMYDVVKADKFAVILMHQAYATPRVFDEEKALSIIARFAQHHYDICYEQINKA